jgi:hypothetical protein
LTQTSAGIFLVYFVVLGISPWLKPERLRCSRLDACLA